MKKLFAVLAFGALAVCAYSQTHAVTRPRITGIDHVSFYTTQPDGVKELYSMTLGLASGRAGGVRGAGEIPCRQAVDRL